MLGSRERLARALAGADPVELVDAGVREAYRTRRVGSDRQPAIRVAPFKAHFGDWAEEVLSPQYRPRHQYTRVAQLPPYVLADSAVAALRPQGADVFISDFQLRHSMREAKRGRSAALPIETAVDLPRRLQRARWVFDSTHDGIIGFFDAGVPGRVGKAVVHFDHVRGGVRYNAVLTTGLVNPENENEREYRSLKVPKT